MNTTTEKTLAAVLGVLPVLVTPASAALAENAPRSGGAMMSNGGSYEHMYGFNSVWLIALVVALLGVALVVVLRKRR